MHDPVNDPCINAPKLAAWLKERDRLPKSLLNGHGARKTGDPIESLYRRLNEWEKGGQTDVHTADYWLTYIGCHLSELPDDFFEEKAKRRRGRNYTPEERRQILRLVEGGKSAREIARQQGVSVKSIYGWRKQAA